jgi:hypothetical protein
VNEAAKKPSRFLFDSAIRGLYTHLPRLVLKLPQPTRKVTLH